MSWRRPAEEVVHPGTITDPVTKDDQIVMMLPKSSAAYEVTVYILQTVASHFKMPLRQIIGNSRTKRTVHARYTAVFLIYSWTQLSLTNLGEIFDRDHSSIHHALQRMTDSLDTEERVNDYTEPLLVIEAALLEKYRTKPEPEEKRVFKHDYPDHKSS